MNIKYLLNFLLLCFLIPVVGQAQTGNCVVFCPNGNKFHLALDNKFQNANENSNVKVTSIPEGDYWVTVLFHDDGKKGFKTNVRVLENKEIAYALEEYNGTYKLLKHSSISISQVKSVNTAQTVLPYNKGGVEVKGVKDANDLKDHQLHSKSEITRVQGDKNDHESKRMGNFSSASGKDPNGNPINNQPATPTKEPETGTFVVSKYIELENADGTSSIVEEKVTTVKEIVERNGQKQLRTKKGTTNTPTDFNCLPMAKEKFVALKKSVQSAEGDERLGIAKSGVHSQCLTPGQIKSLGDLILSEVDRNTFAIAAKSTCADPKKFPYEITEPVAVEEVVKEESEVEKILDKEKEVEEKIIDEHKTETQLKAELKALKQKEKLAKKLEKQKEKLAKAEAKKKAKAEKARLKAEAKAAKKK